MDERQQIDASCFPTIAQLYRLLYLEKMTRRHSSLQQLEQMFSQWQDQSICMVGNISGASKLGSSTSQYYLITMKNTIMGNLEIAIESTEYLTRFSAQMNGLIGRNPTSYFALNNLTFDLIDSKPYYKTKKLSVFKQLSREMYQKWLVPFMTQFYDEKQMSFDWNDYEPHESQTIPHIQLYDVRKKLQTYYENKKVLIGVVEIVQKRIKSNTGTKRTTYKVLLHERFSRADCISYKNYRIQIQYIHEGEMPEDPVVNWGSYAFYNPMLSKSHKTNPIFIIQTHTHNNCCIVRLEETVFPTFAQRYLKNHMKTADILDIQQTMLSRQCFKVCVFMSSLEILMAKWECSRCSQRISQQFCQKCLESGQVSLWLLILVQDGQRCAYLELKSRQAIKFMRFNNEHLSALGRACRQSPNNYIFIYDKSVPVRGLAEVQRLLCFGSNQATMLVVPTIDIPKTIKTNLTPQERAQNQIGFQANRKIEDRLVVNPNGTFFSSTPIVCLKCLKIL